MRISLNIENKMKMLSSMKNESVFQILEYDTLNAANNINSSIALKYIKESGMKLRQARIILDDSAVKIESGSLGYMKGNIITKSHDNGVFGIGKKLLSSKLKCENNKPILYGKGEVFLQPSFYNYALIELEDEDIIIDNELFCACEDSINISFSYQKNTSSMILSDEGFFETRLSGSGIVLLQLPVPESEIFICRIYDDILKVNGNYGILRTANIKFTVEKPSYGLIVNETNTEGVLNVYRGSGEVWLVPTKEVYNDIEDSLTNLTMDYKSEI